MTIRSLCRRVLLGLAFACVVASLSAQVTAPTKIAVKDEGTARGSVGTVDFVGASVTATVSGDTATVTVSAGGTASITTATLNAPTDGLSRYTITDAAVGSTSKIIVGVRQPDVEDVDDHGWMYMANVVKVGTGSFDVVVQVFSIGGEEDYVDPPTGTLSLYYLVG